MAAITPDETRGPEGHLQQDVAHGSQYLRVYQFTDVAPGDTWQPSSGPGASTFGDHIVEYNVGRLSGATTIAVAFASPVFTFVHDGALAKFQLTIRSSHAER